MRFAESVRRAYSGLFTTYPDAHRKDAEALRNFFRAHTSAGVSAQQLMVRTFQMLVEAGDFDGTRTEQPSQRERSGQPVQEVSKGAPRPEERAVVVERVINATPGLTLNVNIQLQLPSTADAEVYDKLFSAMRTHLMGLGGATS
jgi:hypothetical protein